MFPSREGARPQLPGGLREGTCGSVAYRHVKGLCRDRARLSLQILDVGWPELHAPPLDQVCTICKAQETWLNSDPQHVVVIHCRVSAAWCWAGGRGRRVPRGDHLPRPRADLPVLVVTFAHPPLGRKTSSLSRSWALEWAGLGGTERIHIFK